MKKYSGVTLIELIIVLAIMSIIIGIAIPSYDAYKERNEKLKDENLALMAVNAMVAHRINQRLEEELESDDWKTILAANNLWPADQQNLTSDYYTEIVLSGPINGVCTVTLEGEEPFVISRE
ncbi:prepilin-type N-terminal cleavage/methylation domain-containing protein [Acidaminobacter sp. JC074]|nr:prepilin-type N-terminal cleavage/methylation domain-containing protein [Acidaminobacter sp. JC074]